MVVIKFLGNCVIINSGVAQISFQDITNKIIFTARLIFSAKVVVGNRLYYSVPVITIDGWLQPGVLGIQNFGFTTGHLPFNIYI